MGRGIGLLAVACATILLGACASDPSRGYSLSPAHDQGVRTIAVPILDNETYSTGTELLLTEAIIKAIQQTTPWRVTSSAAADSTLTGTITKVGFNRLSRTPGTGLAQEVAVELAVDFDWTDNRTGQVLASRRSFSAVATFIPDRGVGERLELGEHGAIDELAHRIVDSLRDDW